MASMALAFQLDGCARLGMEQRSIFATVCDRLALRPERRRQSPWMEAAWVERSRSPLGVQVAEHPGAGLWVVFSGRLDNRDRLLAGSRLSSRADDATLVLELYLARGLHAFADLLGPFACVVVELRRRRVVMARDRSAGRWLCFHRQGDLLWIADEPAPLAAAVANPRLDDDTVRRFFELREPAPGATFFAEIQEAPAGTALAMDRAHVVREIYPALPAVGDRRWSDDDWELAYAYHLEQAVDRRMDGGSTAVLMSGGLDSTAVAAMAAGRSAGPLTTVSWIFESTPEADERPYIDDANRFLGCRALAVPADSAVPPPESLKPSPDGPFEGPYRLLRRATYERLAPGHRVLLTGEMGDEILADDAMWLASLLRQGRAAEAAQEIGRAVLQRRGIRGTGLRRALGAVLHAPELDEEEELPASTAPFTTWPCHLEAIEAERYGIEIRRPYLDAELRAFVAAVPAHLIHRPTSPKRIVRRAMRGRLPQHVLERSWCSTLLPLPRRFIRSYGPDLWHDLFRSPRSCVFDHVDRRRLESLLRGRALCDERDGPLWVVAWRSVVFELWYRHRRHFFGPAALTGASVTAA